MNIILFTHKPTEKLHRERLQTFPNYFDGNEGKRNVLLLLSHNHARFVSLVAWRSGNALCPINEVALLRAGLVLGSVTAGGQENNLCM